MEVVDMLDKQLFVGSEVIFTFYKSSTMYKGKIIRISERRVYIENEYRYITYINKREVKIRIIKI